MPYPPAPWTLRGSAVQLFRLVDAGRARAVVPPEMEIVRVAPGRGDAAAETKWLRGLRFRQCFRVPGAGM
ncbi:MAG TPA: hypothetical protein VHG91_10280 [Longimicrobium sp.]|nr:hypothetical protein [Longimicrobium sp.]